METPSEKSENPGRMDANAILNLRCVNSQKSADAQLKSEHASVTAQFFTVS